MENNTTDNFVVWKLKPDFDSVEFSESDISFYKNKYSVDDSTSVLIVKSDGTVKDLIV